MVKVSICTPIYNVQNYIEKSARSLFSQTYSNIEYIFVDDCSKDKSIEILKKVPCIKKSSFLMQGFLLISFNLKKGFEIGIGKETLRRHQ